MSREKTKNVGYVVMSKVASFLIGITRGLFVPGYLGPQLYGIVGLLKLVRIILSFFSFGMDQAYLRLGIEYREKDEDEKKKKLQDNVFTFLVISAVAGTLLTICVPFIFKRQDMSLQSLMIFCFAVTAFQHLFQTVGIFYFQTMQIEKRFKFISLMNFLQPAISFVVIIATVFKWEVRAVFAADLIALVTVQVLYFRKSGIFPLLRIHAEEFKKNVRYAIPFFITSVSFYLFRFSDRTIIASFLSLRELGIYSFAVGIAEYSKLLSVSVNEVYTPYVIEEISRQKDLFSLAPAIKAYSYKLMFVTSSIAFIGIFFTPFISMILPKYSESILVLKLLLINTALRTFPLYQILILGSPGVKKQNLINVAMAVCGGMNILLSIYFVKKGFGITGVVSATMIAHILMACFYIIASEKYYRKKKDAGFYLKMAFPVVFLFLYCAVQTKVPYESVNAVFKNILYAFTFLLVLTAVFRVEFMEMARKLRHALISPPAGGAG